MAACSLIAAALGTALAANGQVNVTQHHNNLARTGLYVDPAFTEAAAANLQRDLSFNGSIAGNVYAQPLYLDSGPNGQPAVIVVTESDNVYALDATTGTVIWQTNVGPSVALSSLPCGDISPMGILGTPVVDLPSRSLLFDAMAAPGGGNYRHLIYALDLDTGSVKSGWPVEPDAVASYGGTSFSSMAQGERGALTVVNGIVYVPYGGLDGDCGTYHGWIIGVPLDNPSGVMAWATGANGGGAWGVGGVASDGTNVFIATGNTFNANSWSGGEAVIRFSAGPVFSGQTANYWAPNNWQSLDQSDLDIGGCGPALINVPGASPANLVVALGKDGNAYLLNQANLGGVSAPVAQASVSSSPIHQAAAAYRTTQGSYVAFSAGGYLTALKIGASSPPTISSVWTVNENGSGSPFVTSTDGTNNMIVWAVGCESSQQLYGFDGNTGATVFGGGGANEKMANTRRWATGIVAHGRIYVAADNQVYAFSVATGPSPVANNDNYSFSENTTLTVAAPGVLANDTDSGGYTLTAVLESNPAHGTLTLNSNGGFTYTPATNFSGSDSFTYYASDGTSNSSVATVTLVGTAAGVLFSDNFERTTLPPWVAESGTWTVAGGMLDGNASSGYGQVYVTNKWSNYTVQGSIRFSTASAYGGGIDGRLNPATGARYGAWVYPEGSAAYGPILKLVKFQSWTAWSYLGSTYEPIQQVTLASVGTNWHTLQLSCQSNQLAVYYDGAEVLNVMDAEASPYLTGGVGFDLYAGSNPYTFSVENVTVTGSTPVPPPHDPVANNDTYSFTENTSLTVAAPGVLTNDTDSAGYTLTAVLASGPSQGAITLGTNGGFTYVPVTNFSGTDSFTYYATDGVSNSSVATVTLTGVAQTPPGVLFSDTFNRTTLPPWVAKSGTWSVGGGMLNGSGSAQNYGALYVTNSWTNYTVQATIRFSTASAYGGGIDGRLNPATGARYGAWVYPENSPQNGPIVRLVKFQSWTTWSYQGAAYTPIQQATLASVGTNWHTLQLSFQGNQITVNYDGNQVLSAADGEANHYTSGAIDFDTFTGSTPYTFSVENLTVTQ